MRGPLDHSDPTDGAAACLRLMQSLTRADFDALTIAQLRAYHEREFWRLIWPRIKRTPVATLAAWWEGDP